jgi:predicted PurR-regulated permease PerM
MADPVVRSQRGGEDGDDPRDTGPDAQSAENGAATRDSLFEPPVPTDADNPYGRPGPPVSRSSAFYKGFIGALGVAVALLLVFAFRDALSVLELVLVAVVLAVGLNPIVEFAIRRGVKRAWAVLGVAILVVGVLTLLVIVVGGVLRDQIVRLIDDAPHLLNDLRRHATIRHLDQKYHIITELEQKLKDPDFLTDYFGGVFNVGISVFRGVASVVIVFILTLYFLAGLPTLKRSLYALAPASRRARVGQLGDEILRRVGRYVIGASLVALLAGTVSLLFLLSVGLSAYALPLALMVALLDLIPLVGSILGAAIVSIVGLANSLPIGIACIVFYIIYETLEGYVIYPRVMRSSVDVPEYVTIIAVLVGGTVGGIVGALLALPIGAAILLLVREVWIRRQDAS